MTHDATMPDEIYCLNGFYYKPNSVIDGATGTLAKESGWPKYVRADLATRPSPSHGEVELALKDFQSCLDAIERGFLGPGYVLNDFMRKSTRETIIAILSKGNKP